MLRLLAFLLILGLAGIVYATDTGNRLDTHKVPLPYDPNQGDGREGGETVATAIPILGLPYSDSGNTCDNINDYDEACPYTGSTSPDVVYSFTPGYNHAVLPVDLCMSSYDTKVYVYENYEGNLVACNDDYYFGPPCFMYSSRLEFDAVAGNTYYIVIDGYGGACGEYRMDIETCPPPQIDCPEWGYPEGEPALVDYYIDSWNGGCNSDPNVFQDIHWVDTTTGCGVLCGVSGWYHNNGDFRDTDWFTVTAAGSEMSFEVCAELPCHLFVLNPDCDNITLLYSATTDEYSYCATINWPTNPGDEFWLWVSPTTFSGPYNEFDYVMTVCGHNYDAIPVETTTWGAVKEMYR